MPTLTSETPVHPLLKTELLKVAKKLRNARAHREATCRWLAAIAIGCGLILLQWLGLISGTTSFFSLVGLVVIVTIRNAQMSNRSTLDYLEAARAIEQRHPELKHALLTALEQTQEKGEDYSFLQKRVIHGAVRHARANDWSPRERRWFTPAQTHLAAMAGLFALMAVVWSVDPRLRSLVLKGKVLPPVPAVAVTPGNAEIERGSALVVAARFGAHLPRDAQLVWQEEGAEAHRAGMMRSLSDPIFAYTWTSVGKDLVYWVEYDGKVTEHFKITVYDLPALVRANAALHYPSYTGLTDRTIEDTRRVSAVEGTQLDYTFVMNKALRRATLVEVDGKEKIELTPSNPQKTTFVAPFVLEKSKRYTLQLEDDRGRKNPVPLDIRIEVLPNKVPQLKITFPSGDQRPSPLEEIRVQAEAHDDFGLVDYGIGFAIGDAAPDFASLKPPQPPKQLDATFARMLALESRGVKQDELVSWFAWADDYGPDGKVRRTTSDVFFAEVRPLEEEFREEAANGGDNNQQGGGGGGQESAELLEIQRQISIAIWKQKQKVVDSEFSAQVETIRAAQEKASAQLSDQRAKMNSPALKKAGEQAQNYMRKDEELLAKAGNDQSVGGLDEAWKQSQGAYQALLKLQSRNYRVSQSRSRSGGGGNSRNQRQLNQLEFKQSDSRYETESQAQSQTTPQDRDQLQVLARLRELARRQEDLNQRLRELQTALAAAQDEQKKEEIQRELKRLEEEQRRMLSDVDDTRQRLDRMQDNEKTRQSRDQLNQTREEMRRSSEELSRGETSQALASGARAREQLDQMRDSFRKESASKFSDQMRDARQAARDLDEHQRQVDQQLTDMEKNGAKSLDDSDQRNKAVTSIEQQRRDRDALLEQLRQVSEDAESAEPQLYRKLYDTLRAQGQQDTDKKMEMQGELLRHGLLPQTRELAPDVSKNVSQLRQEVERAAGSVLGDDSDALRFAQNELNDLTRQLERERDHGDPSAKGAGPGDKDDRQAQVGRAGKSANDDKDGTEPGDPSSGEMKPDQGAPAPGQTSSDTKDQNKVADDSSTNEANGQRGQRTSQKPTANRSSRNQGNQVGSDSSSPGANDGANPSDNNKSGQGGSGGSNGVAANDGARQPNNGDQTGDRARGDLDRALQSFNNGGGGGGAWTDGGPLTGDNFGEWNERLRTVEDLMEDPDLRQRLGVARERAEEFRREYKRRNTTPPWGVINTRVVAPLNEARVFLRQELNRLEQPQSLQPVDRDPVPERYAESVRKYYEALGK